MNVRVSIIHDLFGLIYVKKWCVLNKMLGDLIGVQRIL